MKMTKEEKERLVNSVADLSLRDVLQREDMLGILQICRDACGRRIDDLENRVTPSGGVQ